MLEQVVFRFLLHNVIHIRKLPPSNQHFFPKVAKVDSQVHPWFFRQELFVSVEKRLIAESVWSPEFNRRAIFADPGDLLKHVKRYLDVLKEVRRENVVDRLVIKWKAVLRQVKNEIHLRSGYIVQTNEAFSLSAATTDVNSERRFYFLFLDQTDFLTCAEYCS